MKKLVILAIACLCAPALAVAKAPAKAPAKAAKAAKAPAKAAAKAPAKAAAKAPAKAAPAKAIPLYAMDADSAKPPAKGTALAKILAGSNIRVCVRADVPPFGSLSTKGLSGLDVSLANAVVTRLSVNYKKVLSIDWSVINAGARISSLQSKACDLVVAAFSVTAARAKIVGFSKAYLQTDKVLVSAEKITRKTPVIGLVKGTTGSNAGIKGKVRYFNNYQSIIYATERGEIDYVVTDRPIALHMIRSVNSKYKVSKVIAKGAENYAIGVNKGNTALLNAINAALGNLARSGILAHLHRKWL